MSSTRRKAKDVRNLERKIALDHWMTGQVQFLTSARKKGSTNDPFAYEKQSPSLWQPTLAEHLRILHQWRKKQVMQQGVAQRQPNDGSDSFLQAMEILSYWQRVGFLPSDLPKEKVLRYLKDEIGLNDVLEENYELFIEDDPD